MLQRVYSQPGDRPIAMAAVAQNGLALEDVSPDLKGDKSVVMAAVAQNGLALEHASDDLKADKSVVMAAVAQNGLALDHASDDLKADPDVVRAAVEQNGRALDYASLEMQSDLAQEPEPMREPEPEPAAALSPGTGDTAVEKGLPPEEVGEYSKIKEINVTEPYWKVIEGKDTAIYNVNVIYTNETHELYNIRWSGARNIQEKAEKYLKHKLVREFSLPKKTRSIKRTLAEDGDLHLQGVDIGRISKRTSQLRTFFAGLVTNIDHHNHHRIIGWLREADPDSEQRQNEENKENKRLREEFKAGVKARTRGGREGIVERNADPTGGLKNMVRLRLKDGEMTDFKQVNELKLVA